jgi:Uma2 family endonuclease
VSAAVQPITVEQFLNFRPPRGFRSELINGEIVLSPDPKALHYDICERIAKFVEQVCPETAFKVLQRINLRLKTTHEMPSPDVMVIDYPAWVEAQHSGCPSATPFLVVEVISRSNRKKAVEKKVRTYLENGVNEVWVVYPKARLVSIHTPTGSQVRRESDEIRLLAPLPKSAFVVRQLFVFGEKLTRVIAS